jgi:hypothetical protein
MAVVLEASWAARVMSQAATTYHSTSSSGSAAGTNLGRAWRRHAVAEADTAPRRATEG